MPTWCVPVLCMIYNNNECFSISVLQISVYPWPCLFKDRRGCSCQIG